MKKNRLHRMCRFGTPFTDWKCTGCTRSPGRRSAQQKSNEEHSVRSTKQKSDIDSPQVADTRPMDCRSSLADRRYEAPRTAAQCPRASRPSAVDVPGRSMLTQGVAKQRGIFYQALGATISRCSRGTCERYFRRSSGDIFDKFAIISFPVPGGLSLSGKEQGFEREG